MKIIVLLFLFTQVNLSYSQTKNDHIISIIENGNYITAIAELKTSAKKDSIQKKWISWIGKQKIIGECYTKLNEYDALNKTTADIYVIIKRHSITDPKTLGDYHELNNKVFHLKEDMEEAYRQLQKSLYYKSKLHSDKELLIVYKSFLAYYNYKRDAKKSNFYISKLLSIIRKNKIEKNKLIDVYNQIAFSIKLQKYNSPQEYIDLNNRSI